MHLNSFVLSCKKLLNVKPNIFIGEHVIISLSNVDKIRRVSNNTSALFNRRKVFTLRTTGRVLCNTHLSNWITSWMLISWNGSSYLPLLICQRKFSEKSFFFWYLRSTILLYIFFLTFYDDKVCWWIFFIIHESYMNRDLRPKVNFVML